MQQQVCSVSLYSLCDHVFGILLELCKFMLDIQQMFVDDLLK